MLFSVVVKCSDLLLTNGIVEYTSLSFTGTDTTETYLSVGANAIFQCNLGYDLAGDIHVRRVCLSNTLVYSVRYFLDFQKMRERFCYCYYCN